MTPRATASWVAMMPDPPPNSSVSPLVTFQLPRAAGGGLGRAGQRGGILYDYGPGRPERWDVGCTNVTVLVSA